MKPKFKDTVLGDVYDFRDENYLDLDDDVYLYKTYWANDTTAIVLAHSLEEAFSLFDMVGDGGYKTEVYDLRELRGLLIDSNWYDESGDSDEEILLQDTYTSCVKEDLIPLKSRKKIKKETR